MHLHYVALKISQLADKTIRSLGKMLKQYAEELHKAFDTLPENKIKHIRLPSKLLT